MLFVPLAPFLIAAPDSIYCNKLINFHVYSVEGFREPPTKPYIKGKPTNTALQTMLLLLVLPFLAPSASAADAVTSLPGWETDNGAPQKMPSPHYSGYLPVGNSADDRYRSIRCSFQSSLSHIHYNSSEL